METNPSCSGSPGVGALSAGYRINLTQSPRHLLELARFLTPPSHHPLLPHNIGLSAIFLNIGWEVRVQDDNHVPVYRKSGPPEKFCQAMQQKSNRCFPVGATEHTEKHPARFFYLICLARTVRRGRERSHSPGTARLRRARLEAR